MASHVPYRKKTCYCRRRCQGQRGESSDHGRRPEGQARIPAPSRGFGRRGEDGKPVVVSRDTDERTSRELHGLTRAVINNMIVGVKDGYEKTLEVVGVGYICAIQGKQLQLAGWLCQ